MCKEGIRIGRMSDVACVMWTPASTVVTSVLRGDSNRIRVILTIQPALLGSVLDSVVIGPSGPAVLVPVACASAGAPTVILDIERFGSLVTGPLSIRAVSGVAITVAVTEVRLIYDLETV